MPFSQTDLSVARADLAAHDAAMQKRMLGKTPQDVRFADGRQVRYATVTVAEAEVIRNRLVARIADIQAGLAGAGTTRVRAFRASVSSGY
ncbi:hypothetical protein [Falsiroseomonas tokyonensis]|uniref:GpW protein n=1 Tax=Falsiroseomonas tokyonensis TaxID=430521 RepID=A0ABV7C1M3_9PROT|nr:hypothetical protein [Falsiroseomonas tokyonensis]MBU8540824.1 hypothetical protein [Falsiroseomonas tokyonensis]